MARPSRKPIPTLQEIQGCLIHCKAIRATFEVGGPFAPEEVPAALHRAFRHATRRDDMHWAWSFTVYSRNYATVMWAVQEALGLCELPGWVHTMLSKAPTQPTLDETETAICIDGVWLDNNPDAARWHAAWALLHAPFLDDPKQLADALEFSFDV